MILIVDDYRDGAEALCRVLKKSGFPCNWVPSGPEALAAIRAHPAEMPLLVVLDNMMPHMNGVEVLREIRADPQITNTTVVFYSAGFDVEKRNEALTMGAVAWILKGDGSGGIAETIDTISRWYERVGGVKAKQGVT